MLQLMLSLEYGSCHCSTHLISNMSQKLCYEICNYTVDEDCVPQRLRHHVNTRKPAHTSSEI